MPIKRPHLANNEIYHIIIRGVGDSLIFKDVDDYYRAIFSIYEFNTTNPIEIRKQREKRKSIKKTGEHLFVDSRDSLVEILAFCFMPNHIHLLVRQIKDNGITRFMKKLGSGYATYFNKKYNRKGHLFQNRFQAVHIKDDIQLKMTFIYIHINPISLVEPKYKEKGVKNFKKAIKFLDDYKWSSYQDYFGKSNFPSVTKRDFILKEIGGEKKSKELIADWIKNNKLRK